MQNKKQKSDEPKQQIPDPPEKAEGDLETVEESLRQHEKKDHEKNG